MICPNCGVEVENKHSYCPLCLTPLQDEEEQTDAASGNAASLSGHAGAGAPAASSRSLQPTVPRETRLRAGLWVIEALTMVLGVAALVVFAADFAFGAGVEWSRYPLVAIASGWLLGVTAVLLGGHPVLLSVALLTIGALLCFALDRFTGEPFWFLDVVVPVTAVLMLLVSGSVALVRRRQLRPLQVISLLSFSLGIVLVITELSLRHYLTDRIAATWSVLGFACLTAVAVVVLYLHRSLVKRNRDIRRYLHL